MATRATVVWTGVDAPRMEIAHVVVDGASLRATGTQIGAGYELRYVLTGNTLATQIIGGEERLFTLDGADFFDLAYSPLFNSLPVLRDGLLGAGSAEADYVMQWVSVPDLNVEKSAQKYAPAGDGRINFSADGFRAEVQFDPDGFVRCYDGLARRVAAPAA